MKYATLLLGLTIALASIVTARTQTPFYCPNLGAHIEIEKVMVPTCPDDENCRSFKFIGYTITNVPLHGTNIRIKTRTPRRGVSTLGPEIVEVTLDGKRCQESD